MRCTHLQAALAAGLLNLFNWKPRTIGFLGVVASAINCYMLFPPVPVIAKVPAKSVPGNSHKEAEIKPEPKMELKKA